VIVFTASESGYADPILDRIDPKGELISHRFYRQNCIEMEKNLFVKDLRVFGQRPLDKTCIVDNALHSYIINLRNGIPIIPFMHERSDDQLLKLADFLMSLDTEVDIRKSIAAHFSYKEFLGCTDKAQFVEMLKSKVKS
jgi:CTD small phosphatase-like protein 2